MKEIRCVIAAVCAAVIVAAPSAFAESSGAVAAAARAPAASAAPAPGAAVAPPCNAPWNVARLDRPLTRTALRMSKGEKVTVVALGSSSTEGIGASEPAKSYPSRLAVELEELFPGQEFNIINRGVGGETSIEMLARLDRDVAAARPDLVIWQVGSNSVLRDHPLDAERTRLHDGVTRMKAMGADVILLDPQYVPRVLAKRDAEGMVALIGAEAKRANVDLFQRFALMKQWHETQKLPFETFVSSDLLHMNDWGYGCLAKTLAVTIGEAVTRPIMSAVARPAAR